MPTHTTPEKKPKQRSIHHRAASLAQELTRLDLRLAALNRTALEISAERDALLKSAPPDLINLVEAMRAAIPPVVAKT